MSSGGYACFAILFLFTCEIISASIPAVANSRHKRDIWQLCNVVTQFTHRDCTDFVGYGCYCGLGGDGTAVDDIDVCCKRHDECYGTKKCDAIHNPKWTTYEITNKQDHCKDHTGCKRETCECDLSLAKCLHLHQNSYTAVNSAGQMDKARCYP